MVRRVTIMACQIVIIALASASVVASDYRVLPRSHGAFTLGMSIDDFRSATGIQPEPCLHCAKDELYANYPGQSPVGTSGVTAYSPGEGVNETNSVLLFFMRGKLYRIETGENYGRDIHAVTKQYASIFGRPPKTLKLKSGITEYSWRDRQTVFYVVQEVGNNSASETVYLDRALDPQKSH